MSCPLGSDNVLGPRILEECRPFDFTLLFEDAIFAVVPASTFLLLAACRLPSLIRAPIKVTSHRLAAWKLGALAVSLTFQILHLAYQQETSLLYTNASLAASLLQLFAVAAAALLSWLEDQRSVRPSDIMVLYFFVATLLALPRARTLWLLSPVVKLQAILWTLVTIATAGVLCIESIHKTQVLRLAYQQSSKEYTSSFWVRSFFIWVLPLFQSGFSSILALHDMPEVDRTLQGQSAENRLHQAWAKSQKARKYKLVRATFRAYLWPFVSAVVPRLCLTAFTFCQPFLISATLDFISDTPTSENSYYGPALVGAFVLTYLGMAISTAVYWRQTFRFNTTIRAGLISLIYRQTNKMHAGEFKTESSITLMGTDVERIVRHFWSIHEAWAGPVDVTIGVFLLARQLGVASLIPAVISIIVVIATIPISQRSGTGQKRWIERVQMRLDTTSSMLNDMKSVKMLGLGDKLYACVSTLRQVELKVSQKFRVLLIWQVVLSNMPVTFAPFATFAIYAIIQSVRGGQSLLANRMFTSLSLISLMTDPLLIFIQTLPSLWEAVSCFSRIEQYCTKASMETSVDNVTTEDGLELSSRPSSTASPRSVIEFQNAGFSWTSTGPQFLHGINFTVEKGQITAIIGPVGSGKSTLLESSLGETTLREGSLSPFSTSVAYCPQTPWIMNDTIRQNIIGPAEYDPKWYNFVVWACALETDFENIAGGDMSKAGSSGITLSGGQKQRISLARAVYSRAPTLVLDDVFSGLDNKSVVAITTRLLASDGHFRESGRTAILATHNNRLLPHADKIVILENGTVRKIGSFQEIEPELPQDHHSDSDDSSNEEVTVAAKQTPAGHLDKVLSTAEEESAVELNQARRDGKWSVYSYYFKSAGWTIMFTLVATICIYGFTDKFSSIWLDQWSDANEKNPNQSPAKALFVPIISNTGRTLHSHLLKATLNAPFSFFQKTDAGLTTNRFSQDLELIDMDLPVQAINANMSFANCVVQLVLLCILGKYLAITVPALGIILFFVQSYYLRTSRQVRLLDIEAKSPLFTHFVETMQGINVIRAMRWQVPFQTRLQELLNQSQKPFYMLFCIRQWLQLVLDCIVMGLAVVLVSLVVSLRSQFSAGSIGVALNLILAFNQDLMQFIKSWTVLETSIGAVARIQDFVESTPSEEKQEGELSTVPPQWPERGDLTFDRVTASYGPDSPSVLKELSLAIKPGQKIAVCGPSGSGKTSLILGLLQMIDLQEGSITLDGVDLSRLPCSTVRSRINVVPQEPFFMPGTLRFNLDRQLEDNPVPDSILIRALEAVGLWKKVREDCPGGGELDQPLSISNWSMGERQMLALARALVMKSSVLVLDEAMSSVDWETEATMQEIIEREFTSHTIISVIHRLRYVENYDRVALMKQGRLVEYASPQELLAAPSQFASFYYAKKASR
ncbi:uncharacterized protein N7496_012194 [Penicillium cataractarum]|uniref:Uncharacterized protein n=1 Tax=Penicillium cataractarum TaxID=2100454 RepID=A0A9W9R7B9_9EURO|nr:uncharacterized protein N7496_012194 [Penicillium cataractarum]KAJ5354982.1 hypothetical protein N7496_012194 [Penicillium cataractarum]